MYFLLLESYIVFWKANDMPRLQFRFHLGNKYITPFVKSRSGYILLGKRHLKRHVEEFG